jgi:hypothetical protein
MSFYLVGRVLTSGFHYQVPIRREAAFVQRKQYGTSVQNPELRLKRLHL